MDVQGKSDTGLKQQKMASERICILLTPGTAGEVS